MAILPSHYRCMICRGLEQQVLDNPDILKHKQSGFSTDTNTLMFFYKNDLCRMQGIDVGKRPDSVDLSEIGALKNDNSVTIAGVDRLWNFKGYMSVFPSLSPVFVFMPFDNAKYDIIPTKRIIDTAPVVEHKRPWWHP